MGMANSKPGEFSQEEITDPENLINVSKMANDNDFNAEAEESETVVSILGIDPIDSKELGENQKYSADNAMAMEDYLKSEGYETKLFYSFGREECAACGMLAGKKPNHEVGQKWKQLEIEAEKLVRETGG